VGSSRDAATDSVYKWLVRKYTYDHPGDPHGKLSDDILKLENQGRSKDRAILELALKSGYRQSETEAIQKHRTSRKDAMTVFLRTHKLRITDDENETGRIIGNTTRKVVYHPAPASQNVRELNRAWYLIPIIFSLVGGLVGYVAAKDDDSNMASNLMLLGFLVFIGQIMLYWWLWL
jgi:hypothetical protein